jgi:hypothetical protein
MAAAPPPTKASAPHAGKFSIPSTPKFNDHYAILGVDASADTGHIDRAYAKMLEKYGPENIDTRDDEKFAVIQVAYETLTDPIRRKEFDTLKGVSGDHGRPMFTGPDFFEVLGRGVGLRIALLCVFYDRRRNRPFTPALSMRHIESMVEGSIESITFALWYLKQRNYVINDDKSNLQITVEGMDFLESHQPTAKDVMPFIKTTAIAADETPNKPPSNPIAESLNGILAATRG